MVLQEDVTAGALNVRGRISVLIGTVALIFVVLIIPGVLLRRRPHRQQPQHYPAVQILIVVSPVVLPELYTATYLQEEE